MFSILVVDDDLNMRILEKAILEREGYKVTLSKNGKEALLELEHTHVDLIILDIMMKEMDGYEFCKTLRYTNSELPILMVSAKILPKDVKEGFRVGTDDYMTKPFDEEELLLRIKALLRRSHTLSEKRITLGSITLDYEKFTIKRGDEEEELPQKEFLLLYKLFSQPGKIFTRVQLMDEIWGVDSETGWESLTVHIMRLRKRFESWNEFEIVSVRGLGYKVVIKNK